MTDIYVNIAVYEMILNSLECRYAQDQGLGSSFLLGLMPYFSSRSRTSFCLLPISSSRALRVDCNMATLSLRDCLV